MSAAAPIRIPFFDLRGQHRAIEDEILPAVLEVVRAQAFILGEAVSSFEQHLASYLGVSRVVTVASGTDALVLGLHALGVGPKDGVITTALSFMATAEAIVRVGARPIFADVDRDTGNLSIEKAAAVFERERREGRRVRAVLPVHLFGCPARVDAFRDLAHEHGASLVQDAAQAIGARCQGRPISSFGDATALSFFPSKNLGGWGDGGALATDDDRLAERVRSLRVHGSREKEHFAEVGYNSRLDALQAAVLSTKLKHLSRWTEARRAAAARYRTQLAPLREHVVPLGDTEGHVFHAFVVRTRRRDALLAHLRSAGIEARAYYTRPIHRQEALAAHARDTNLPETEAFARESLALPLYPELTNEAQDEVIDAVERFFVARA